MELHKPCFTKNQAKNDMRWQDKNFSCPLPWHDRKQRTEDLWEVPNTVMFWSLNWIKQLTVSPSKLLVITFYFSFYFKKIDYVLPWVDFCMEGTLVFVCNYYRSFKVWCFGGVFFGCCCCLGWVFFVVVVAITLAIRAGMDKQLYQLFYRTVHNP